MANNELTINITGDFVTEEARKQVEKMTIEQACNVIARYRTCDKCQYWIDWNYCNQNEDRVTNPKWYCADWQPRTEEAA